MARAIVFLVLLLAGTPSSVFAQATLTLEQAMSEALSRNRSVAAARTSIAEARSGVTEARATLFPQLTVAESWQRGDQPVFVFSSLLSSRRFAASNFAIDALNHPDPIGFFRTSIGLEQTLYDGGRDRLSVQAAALRREMASLQADQASSDVAFAVVETFGRALTAQAARRAAEAGVESAREDVRRAERRRDAGMATEADVLSLRVHLADLEQRAIQARGDAAVAIAELNHEMGAPIARDYQVVEPASAAPDASAADAAPALIAEALASRALVKTRGAQTELAETLERQSRAAFIPRVSAQAAFDVSGTTFNDRASSWLVGGELRWSFSTGGAELARLRAAADAASRARIEQEDARARVEVDVISALRRRDAARAREEVGRASVEQARESQRIIRDRFDAGISGIDEVLRASTAVLDAEARRTGAAVDAMIGQAMLDRAVGRVPSPKGSL